MSEQKHADLWDELVDEAGEEEIDRAVKVSAARVEADLRAAGFDVAAERAKAGAFLEALEKSPAETKPASPPAEARAAKPLPARRPRGALFAWLAAAASFGAVVGGSLVGALEPSGVVTAPPPVHPSPQALASAAELRRRAAVACDAEQWAVCLADLDKARVADPEGDETPTTRSLRDRSVAAILAKP